MRARRSSPVLGECGLWPLLSLLVPRKACLMLRGCREGLGEGSDLLLDVLSERGKRIFTVLAVIEPIIKMRGLEMTVWGSATSSSCTL